MLKTYFTLVLLLACALSYGQEFDQVDSIVSNYPSKFSKPEKLAAQIASDFTTDREKVRALYTWIAGHVSYVGEESKKYKYKAKNQQDRRKKEAKYIKKLSKRVVSKRIAVNKGYAILFKSVCDLLDIRCEKITGNGKTRIRDIGRRFTSNHVWNKVYIDNEPYLVDVTWGAGSNHADTFNDKINYHYFLTTPKTFFINHYPDQFNNSLLSNKVEKKAYLNTPVYFRNNTTNHEIVAPENGMLDRKVQAKIDFKIKSTENIETLSYTTRRKPVPITEYTYEDGVLSFSLNIKKIKSRSLKININDKAFAGYRLK